MPKHNENYDDVFWNPKRMESWRPFGSLVGISEGEDTPGDQVAADLSPEDRYRVLFNTFGLNVAPVEARSQSPLLEIARSHTSGFAPVSPSESVESRFYDGYGFVPRTEFERQSIQMLRQALDDHARDRRMDVAAGLSSGLRKIVSHAAGAPGEIGKAALSALSEAERRYHGRTVEEQAAIDGKNAYRNALKAIYENVDAHSMGRLIDKSLRNARTRKDGSLASGRDVAEDVGKSLISGTINGLVKLPGSTVDLVNFAGSLGASGLSEAERFIMGRTREQQDVIETEKREHKPFENPLDKIGSEAWRNRAIELAAAGQELPVPVVRELARYFKRALEYETKTNAGDFAHTAGEFSSSSLLPGGAGRTALAKWGNKVLKRGVIPGVSSEAAGKLAEGTRYEPHARMAGAAAGVIGGHLAIRRPGETLTWPDVAPLALAAAKKGFKGYKQGERNYQNEREDE